MFGQRINAHIFATINHFVLSLSGIWCAFEHCALLFDKKNRGSNLKISIHIAVRVPSIFQHNLTFGI